MKGTFSKEEGFTLIELLVVISVIGLLSSMVLASLNRARAKARDVRRIANLNSISKALELYYDTNRQYPPEAASACDSSRGTAGSCPGAGTTWAAGGLALIAPQFISVASTDPQNSTTFYYVYEPVVGQTQFSVTCPSANSCAYILSARLEDATSRYANPGCDSCNPSNNYCVAGGGARLNNSTC